MSERKFQLIKISGSDYERGVQYGRLAQKKIKDGLSLYRERLKSVVHLDWREVKEQTKEFLPIINAYAPELLEEARGISEGAGVEFEEILILNCRTELQVKKTKSHGDACTAAVVLKEATADGKVILGQNWDYYPSAMDTTVLLSIVRPDGLKIMGLAEAGQLLRNGLNSCGIGVCGNFISSTDDYGGVGVPITFVRRKILSCDRFSDALGAVFSARRTISSNYLIACKDGMAIDLEATPRDTYRVFPEDGTYAHANHIQSPGPVNAERGFLADSFYRDKRLMSLLKEKAGHITIQDVMKCFTDHWGYPDSICRHYDERDGALTGIETNASIVMDLEKGRMYVSCGPPCGAMYTEYSFDD